MDWNKTKKIFIFILIIINGVLLVLNFNNSREYKISSDQEKTIFKVMSDNGITLYTDIVGDFSPKRQLSAEVPAIDYNALINSFFGENETYTQKIEFDKTIISSDTKILTVSGNDITFEDSEGTGFVSGLNSDRAISAAEQYLSKLNYNFENYKADDVVQDGNIFIVSFIDSFKGYKIFSSMAKVYISEKGIIKFEASLFEVDNFTGAEMEICSCDEILMTFLYEMKNQNRTSDIFIEDLEFGYYLQDNSVIDEGGNLKLVPSYRIVVFGDDSQYIINAYTNELRIIN